MRLAPALLAVLLAGEARAQEEHELARKLANPVPSLISVPFQSNFDFGPGPGDDIRWLMNFQPVIPIKLSSDWNLITRHDRARHGAAGRARVVDRAHRPLPDARMDVRRPGNHLWSFAGDSDRPIFLTASQVAKVGKLPVSFGAGGGVYVEAPDGGPEWRLRFVVTLILPE